MLEPSIPADVRESLSRLGVDVEAVELEPGISGTLEPHLLTEADLPTLLDSPVMTYHVTGSSNRLLLQVLRLQAVVKTKVERARQWQRTFKHMASTGGSQALTQAQVRSVGLGDVLKLPPVVHSQPAMRQTASAATDEGLGLYAVSPHPS